MPSGSVLYEAETVTVYYRLDQYGRLLMGGRSASRDIDGPAQLAHLTRYAQRLWPQLARRALDARVERAACHHARPLPAYP